ncbi:MAG: hypothetical protein AVDCRST_MAG34-2673 [uncultured Nocardioidaceae bacterium]|uniref:Aminoglycoside phosphotransferase domain-containing protein n=1 Tax=uncultured Nocardioidaceae bacterium TaxID=253824 RepID=A0A6J4MMR7_9ACTN|nr:MAG: hypothetical protein AVDCRST_MAG34-2673 [uncultured Nocardioidaceae bacterium]
MRLPVAVERAAAALGVPAETLSPIGGATGQSWACGDHVVRIGTAEGLRRELLAMSAAAVAVPVPEVLQCAHYGDGPQATRAALLMSRLPGRPAGEVFELPVTEAGRIGEACGRLHARLAVVAAPAGVDAAPDGSEGADAEQARSDTASGACLLHLDLHPLNVLVEAGEVTGVLDWSNAAAGEGVLDRARTWSVLTLEPVVLPFRDEPRFSALREGWSAAGGFEELPVAARRWACRYMLRDLAGRYSPDRLAHVRRLLAQLD